MSTETRFAGPIPALYDAHMGPVLFEPYARDIASRIPSAARKILEVAAGTGRVTRHLARGLAAEGAVTVTDLNEPMLAIARSQLGDDPRLRFQTADAQALPFTDRAFDTVVCQFGLMFVPDKVLALREMRRVLEPGGVLLLSTWDDLENNPASAALHRLAFATLPDNPPLFMKVPFSMPDRHELERLATEAGFRGIRVETVGLTGVAQSAAHLAYGFVRGNPLWNQLVERDADVAALEGQVAAELATRFGDKPCRTPMSAHVLTAFA